MSYLASLSRKKYFLLSLLLTILSFTTIIILYLPTNGLFQNQYDDSYITYRYAINWANGKGLLFNTNDRADAASSFLYTVLLALFYKIGIHNLEFVGAMIGILSAVIVSFLVYKSIKRITKNTTLAFICGYSVSLHGFISGWSISGMEAVLFTAVVTYFIYLYVFLKSNNSVLISISLILVILTRMEGVLLFALWGIFEFYKLIINKLSLKNFVVSLIPVVLTLLALYGVKYAYYGSLISNAVAFKRIATYYQPNPTQLFISWIGTSLIVITLAFATVKIKSIPGKIFLYVYSLLSFLTFIIGPHSDGARYSIHILPITIILAACTLNYMLNNKKNGRIYNKYIVILLLVGILSQSLISAIVVRSFMVRLVKGQECRREIGQYIQSHYKSLDQVISGDVGTLAYQAINNNFIDIAGLTSSDILKAYQEKKTIDSIILSKKPKVLADTFFVNKNNYYEEPVLLNKAEHIKGMKVYSQLFKLEDFKDPLITCSDGQRAYAAFNIEYLYRK